MSENITVQYEAQLGELKRRLAKFHTTLWVELDE